MPSLTRRHLIAGMACAGFCPSAYGAPRLPPGDALAFKVFLKDAEIGTHRLAFATEGDGFTVTIAVELVVRFGPIPLYRYRHHTVEQWQRSQFIALDSTTDDNGDAAHATIRREDDGSLTVDGSKSGRYRAPAEALPATHWNEAELSAPLINPQDGKLFRPTVTDGGEEAVKDAAGASIPARHFALSGDLALDLWYDEHGLWQALRFASASGAVLHYRRL